MHYALLMFGGLTMSLFFGVQAAAPSLPTDELILESSSSPRPRKRSVAELRTIEEGFKRQRAATQYIDLCRRDAGVVHVERVDLLAEDRLWGQSLKEHMDETHEQGQWVIACVPCQELLKPESRQVHTNGRALYAYVTHAGIHDLVPFHQDAMLRIRDAAYYLVTPREGKFATRYIGNHKQLYTETPEGKLLRMLLDGQQDAQQFCDISDYYFARGRFHESIVWLKRARLYLRKKGKPYSDILNDLATVYVALTLPVHAKGYLNHAERQARRHHQPFGYILANKASIYWREDDLNGAIELYTKAIARLSKEGEATDWVLNNIGSAYEMRGDLLNAAQNYYAAIQKNGELIDALANLLYLAAADGRGYTVPVYIPVTDIARKFLSIPSDRKDVLDFIQRQPKRYEVALALALAAQIL